MQAIKPRAALHGNRWLVAELERELDVLRRAGLHRSLRRVECRHGAEILVDGRPAVDFSSNDYLGLATDDRIGAATATALNQGQMRYSRPQYRG